MAITIYNLFVFITTLAPIIAIIINRIPLRGKRYFYLVEFSSLSIAFFLLAVFQNWRWGGFSRYVWFLYFFEVAAFLFMFNRKFGYNHFNHSLAATMLIVYVLSEAHEYLGFLLSDYMKLYIDPFVAMAGFVPVWQRILNNLYVIIAFLLGCRIAGIKRNKLNVLLFLLSLLIPLPFLVFPGLNPMHIVKRALLFVVWFLIFMVRSNKHVGV